jgi:sigma-B regulation protein RsbU (phosphoserine phosphatase)
MQAEIQLAREIHAALVPVTGGRVSGIEWRGCSRPSGDVGGDLVDVLPEGPADWIACVADVSGHGVAASLLMGMFKTALHAHARQAADLADLAGRIHATLFPLKQTNMFVTCALLRRVGPRRFEYLLAGHPPFMHVRRATGARWVGEPDVAIGLLEQASFTSRYIDVEAGDLLIVITDGLLEVFDRQDRELGTEGLARAIVPLSPEDALEHIETALFSACRAHGAQLDDQTTLIVRVASASSPAVHPARTPSSPR